MKKIPQQTTSKLLTFSMSLKELEFIVKGLDLLFSRNGLDMGMDDRIKLHGLLRDTREQLNEIKKGLKK